MTKDEIFERILYTMDKKGLNLSNVSASLECEYKKVVNVINKKTSRMYFFLDLLDSIGLKLVFNETEIAWHQDLIDFLNAYIKSLKSFSYSWLSDTSKVSLSTVRGLLKGEDINIENLFKVLDALNIEVRII